MSNLSASDVKLQVTGVQVDSTEQWWDVLLKPEVIGCPDVVMLTVVAQQFLQHQQQWVLLGGIPFTETLQSAQIQL